MRYGSVCSGIEAATVAWDPLGWQAEFYSEIEPFPCHVLHEHYSSGRPQFMPDPDEPGLKAKDRKARAAAIKSVSGLPERANGVPNHGDMTQFEEWPDHAIDLLVGGTPCQDYSIAGLRAGMDGVRGSLTLTYAAIVRRYRPRWLVWENVFGVLSSKGGRDFASFLGLLSGRRIEVPADGWKSAGIVEGYGGAYGLAWRVLDTQYVRVDGAPRALPQRRRRVFVVGHSGGDWRRAAAVLFEREGLSGNPAPSRKAGQKPAPTLSARTKGGGGLGTDFDLDGGLVRWPAEVCPTLDTYYGDKMGLEDQHVFNQKGGKFVPGSPLAFDWYASQSQSMPINDNLVPPLKSTMQPAITVAIRGREGGATAELGGEVATALRASQGGGDKPHVLAAVGCDTYNGTVTGDVAATLGTQSGDGLSSGPSVLTSAVRRLTPVECARLQGFSDHHCRIPWRGKPAEQCPDGPQYKAYGNSMSTNVMRWIGQRIEFVDRISSDHKREAAE